MARDLTAGMVAEVTAASLAPIFLFKAEFDSGNLQLWTGFGEITFNSDVYTGGGDLLGISSVLETQDIKATGISVRLTGLTSEIISIALAEDYQGRAFSLYFGCLSAGALVANPFLVFKGKMDVIELDDSGEAVDVSLSVENQLIDLEKPNARRYTSEDHKVTYEDDKFFDFVPDLQEREIILGKSKA